MYKSFLLQTCNLIGQRQKLKNIFTPIAMVIISLRDNVLRVYMAGLRDQCMNNSEVHINGSRNFGKCFEEFNFKI